MVVNVLRLQSSSVCQRQQIGVVVVASVVTGIRFQHTDGVTMPWGDYIAAGEFGLIAHHFVFGHVVAPVLGGCGGTQEGVNNSLR